MIELGFSNPEYMWLLVLIPLLIITHFVSFKKMEKRALTFANFEAISKVMGKKLLKKNFLIMIIHIVAVSFLILSISGAELWFDSNTGNFDVVIAIDNSGSMLTEDYKPNRLEAAKKSAMFFVNKTYPGINVGIVSFSGISFTEQIPITNKQVLFKALDRIEVKKITGTAIGDVIVTSTNLLEGSEKPKMIILITDGKSNSGISIETASEYAKTRHVVINTIGIGTPEYSSELVTLPLDEDALKRISEETGGEYYRTEYSGLNEAFEKIFESSNKKISLKISTELMLIAIILISLEWAFQNTKFKIIPE